MGLELSLLMALKIILVLKDDFPKKGKIMTLAQIKKNTLRILFISLLMREPGRWYNHSKEKHTFIWNKGMSNEFGFF